MAHQGMSPASAHPLSGVVMSTLSVVVSVAFVLVVVVEVAWTVAVVATLRAWATLALSIAFGLLKEYAV